MLQRLWHKWFGHPWSGMTEEWQGGWDNYGTTGEHYLWTCQCGEFGNGIWS